MSITTGIMSEEKDYIKILDRATTLKEMGFLPEKSLEQLMKDIGD